MARIDFFIAGVQKGGTTALDAMLRRHPAIQMAARKEPHFFNDDARDWSAPDYEALHALYDWSRSDVVRGEATPIYTYWPNAIERIAAYAPRAKLIVALRRPVERAFSHWRMEVSRKAERMAFAKAIREGRARVGAAHRVYSYVERGFYAEQIARVLAAFPRAQVHVLRTDALWRDPNGVLAGVHAFLGVAPLRTEEKASYVAPRASRVAGAMAAADRDYLLDLFAADIRATAAATGLDLDDWLDPDYQEPMAPD